MKEKIKPTFFLLEKDSSFIKSLNYVVTSDYNQSYLETKKLKLIHSLKWLYFSFILFSIAVSFIPLVIGGDLLEENNMVFLNLNITLFCIFVTDYLLRWITYRFRASENSKHPLIFFPFTGVSIILLLTILPSFLGILSHFFDDFLNDEDFITVNNTISSIVILQIGRIALLLNIVESFRIFTRIFKKQRKILFYVFSFLILITLLFSIVIYRAEFQKNTLIKNYWDAFYFTIVSIFAIGYGDIIPITLLGRIAVILLGIVGIGIFTIPSAVIAAGFLYEIQNAKKIEKEIEKENKTKYEKSDISLLEKTIAESVKQVKKAVINHTNHNHHNPHDENTLKKEINIINNVNENNSILENEKNNNINNTKKEQ